MERLQIASRDVILTGETEATIRAEAARLDSLYARILACRVLVETPHRHLRDGALHNVRIDLTVPGGELVVKRQPEKELLTAIQRAFEAARRRLEDYAQVQRGAVRTNGKPSRARITKLYPYEGYGFLKDSDGNEIYFHRNSVLNEAFDRLEIGMMVRYTEEEGEQGPQASTVAPPGKKGRRRHAQAG